jgi:hypothetical protein
MRDCKEVEFNMKSKIKPEDLKTFDIMIEIKETLVLWLKFFFLCLGNFSEQNIFHHFETATAFQ